MHAATVAEVMTGDTLPSDDASLTQHHAERIVRCVTDALAALFDLAELHVPVPLLLSFVILLLLAIGVYRVLRPLVGSWMVKHTSYGGTAGGLLYIHRNITVRLPPFAYVRAPNYNVFLQNAVLVYVYEHLWRGHTTLFAKLPRCRLTIDLLDPYRCWRECVSSDSPFQAGAPVRRGTDRDDDVTLAEVERLRVVSAPVGSWAPTLFQDIELSFEEEPYMLNQYSQPWLRRTLTLRCRATPGAAAKLDGFVQRALEVFAEGAPRKEESDARWFFTYGGEAGDKVLFQQYVLRHNKGFDTLFFPRREATLTLIDQFVQQRGRFAVEGFPQKLGFLLYGPAGTGRHTFVKALAAYTGRHIVSVPLSKLRTNQQLYDIFFVREFQAEEEGSVQRLRMEDVIFLFDDVDASEPVVCARAARRVVQRRGAARLSARADGGGGGDGALTNCVIEMDTTSSSRAVVTSEESALPLALLMDLVLGGGGEESSGGGKKDAASGGGGGGEGGGHAKAKSKKGEARGKGGSGGGSGGGGGHLFAMNDIFSGENKDKLDLAGLLNVLDGVVDAPGRMVVMITEHPEWLDPALIRPGRFSARLRFDYMEMAALLSMLGLYYGAVVHDGADGGVGGGVGNDAVAEAEARARAARVVHRELSAAQAGAVRAAVAALEAEAEARGEGCGYRFHVTPCEVEMLCMEQDTLEDFLSQLAGVVRGTVQL